MNLGMLTEILGHQGIRTIWKLLLVFTAFGILGQPQFVQNWLDFELGAPLFKIRYIVFVFLLIFAWMMHKNQF